MSILTLCFEGLISTKTLLVYILAFSLLMAPWRWQSKGSCRDWREGGWGVGGCWKSLSGRWQGGVREASVHAALGPPCRVHVDCAVLWGSEWAGQHLSRNDQQLATSNMYCTFIYSVVNRWNLEGMKLGSEHQNWSLLWCFHLVTGAKHHFQEGIVTHKVLNLSFSTWHTYQLVINFKDKFFDTFLHHTTYFSMTFNIIIRMHKNHL